MFVGAVPMPVVNQLLRAVDCSSWREIFVCCSGSFRVDRALKERWPNKGVRGNDVSLVSCAVGALLTGRAFEIRFKGRLAFMEEHEFVNFPERVAAVIVALRLGQFSAKNAYVRPKFLRTTAFTDLPVSMKYRGIYELANRKPGQLTYELDIRTQEPAAAIYRKWLDRFGSAQNQDRPRGSRRAATP